MKSFAKAFRATLSIALVLCMVMSFVTVSADATAVTVTQVKDSLKYLNDGYYEVEFEVSGITAADADATIMVYSGDAPSKETIKYANQADATDGSATFTMEVPAGTYTVKAGGTGATAGTATLTANTAPVFAQTSYTATLDTDAAAGTEVATVAATDVDGDTTISYTLTGSDLFDYVNGKVVTKAALTAGVYNLTLTANDGIATATATIAVTVEAATIVVKGFTYATEAIVVEYGTTEITFPAVSYEGVAFDATWACDEYDAKVAGNYQFLAKVSGKDGYDIASAAVPAVTVTVKKAQISAFDAIEAISVDYGTVESELPLPATVKAGDFVFEVEAWNCEGYTAQTGSYTFTATVKANANCEVAEDAKATVVVNVGPKPIEKVTITKFVVDGKAAAEAFTGTSFDKLGLGTKAIAYAGEEAVATFEIEWDVDAYKKENVGEQTITGTVNVENTEGIEYVYAENTNTVKATITLSIQVFDGTIESDLGTVFVKDGTEYEDVALPKTVTVTYNGDQTYEAKIVWPEEADWYPPNFGEPEKLYAEKIELLENIKCNDIPYVTIATVSKELDVEVNGKSNENGFILALGKAINVAAIYDDITEGDVSYEYAVTERETDVVITDGVEIDNKGANATITIDAEEDDLYSIVVTVKLGDEVVASKVVNIYMASTEYKASVYVNPSEKNETYSAIRVNRAAGMTVKAVFKNFNDADYNFPGEFKFELIDYKTSAVVAEKTSNEQTVVFSAEDLASLNGAYTVKVTYSEGGEALREVSRTTNISGIALWYTDLTINGKTGSGIIARKDKDLVHKFTLSELGGNDEVYVGSDITNYGEPVADDVVLETTNSVDVETSLNVSDKANGAYTLYALAKLTKDQSYYDLAVGRTVYLQNSISTICNVNLNGSTHSVPENIEDGLTVVPYKGNANEAIEGVSYSLKFYKYVDTEFVEIPELAVESFNEEATITDTDAFAFMNKVVLTVNINGEFDKKIEKVFYAVR